ncbi:hypothetical protein G6F35_014771 [Rhizopus arrhizus]|nr:hypothetical protein G6F35_014771 [Rhizopus arrhizus]
MRRTSNGRIALGRRSRVLGVRQGAGQQHEAVVGAVGAGTGCQQDPYRFQLLAGHRHGQRRRAVLVHAVGVLPARQLGAHRVHVIRPDRLENGQPRPADRRVQRFLVQGGADAAGDIAGDRLLGRQALAAPVAGLRALRPARVRPIQVRRRARRVAAQHVAQDAVGLHGVARFGQPEAVVVQRREHLGILAVRIDLAKILLHHEAAQVRQRAGELRGLGARDGARHLMQRAERGRHIHRRLMLEAPPARERESGGVG